jgi:hypothetical protein
MIAVLPFAPTFPLSLLLLLGGLLRGLSIAPTHVVANVKFLIVAPARANLVRNLSSFNKSWGIPKGTRPQCAPFEASRLFKRVYIFNRCLEAEVQCETI